MAEHVDDLVEWLREEITAWLRDPKNAPFLALPRGSLKIDWGDETVSYTPSHTERVPRRAKRRAALRRAG